MPKTLLLGPRVVSSSSNCNSNGYTSNGSSSGSLDYGCCRSCHLILRDPFIRCHVCSVKSSAEEVYICLACFSKGLSFITLVCIKFNSIYVTLSCTQSIFMIFVFVTCFNLMNNIISLELFLELALEKKLRVNIKWRLKIER